jgi:ADP-ribose pyrophosphatase YjhB (NUDIX family)
VSAAPAGVAQAHRREVYFHDPAAPPATRVVPAAFTAVHGPGGALLLVQRCDSGVWELPGGAVDVGETVQEAAVRETAEEAGVRVRITGLVGLYSDPQHLVRGTDGLVRQPLAVVLDAEPVGDQHPRPDGVETCSAAWMDESELVGLRVEPATRMRIAHILSPLGHPHLG